LLALLLLQIPVLVERPALLAVVVVRVLLQGFPVAKETAAQLVKVAIDRS